MAIFIDTAREAEAREAQELGWVRGITTNPILLAGADGTPEKILEGLAQIRMGPLFYQLTAPDLEGMLEEAQAAFDLVGEQLTLKIPPTATGFRAVARLSDRFPCCVTALYSVAQAVVAREAGACYVVVYVSRATRALGDGIEIVRNFARAVDGTATELLAASIKTPEEAVAALQVGAHHLTMGLGLLKTLVEHPLSEEAVSEFASKGAGIKWSNSNAAEPHSNDIPSP